MQTAEQLQQAQEQKTNEILGQVDKELSGFFGVILGFLIKDTQKFKENIKEELKNGTITSEQTAKDLLLKHAHDASSDSWLWKVGIGKIGLEITNFFANLNKLLYQKQQEINKIKQETQQALAALKTETGQNSSDTTSPDVPQGATQDSSSNGGNDQNVNQDSTNSQNSTSSGGQGGAAQQGGNQSQNGNQNTQSGGSGGEDTQQGNESTQQADKGNSISDGQETNANDQETSSNNSTDSSNPSSASNNSPDKTSPDNTSNVDGNGNSNSDDSKPDSFAKRAAIIGGGVATVGATGTLVGVGVGKSIETIERRRLNSKYAKPEDLGKLYKNQAEILRRTTTTGMSPERIAAINKAADKLEEMAKLTDNLSGKGVFQTLDELVNTGILGKEDLLKLMKLDPIFTQKLADIAGDQVQCRALFKAIHANDLTKAKKLLGLAESADIPPELLKSLKNTSSVEDLTKCVRLFGEVKTISKLGKFAKVAPAMLDSVFFGIDIWMYLDAEEEAKAIEKYNKERAKIVKERALGHLLAGGGSVLLGTIIEVAALCGAVGGPFGIIAGAALMGVTFAVDHIIDVYYDVHNFYAQNRADYEKQTRTEIKQAIWTATVGTDPNVELSWNEKFAGVDKQVKVRSLEQAYEALLLLDVKNDTTIPEADQEKHVQTRMKYIKAMKNDPAFLAACRGPGGLDAIHKLVAKAGFYDTMVCDQTYTGPKDPTEENLQKYHTRLATEGKKEQPTLWTTYEQAFFGNPPDPARQQTFFILYGQVQRIEANKDLFGKRFQENPQIQKNIDTVKRLYTYCTFGLAPEHQPAFHNIPRYTRENVTLQRLTSQTLTPEIPPHVYQDVQTIGSELRNGSIDKYMPSLDMVSDDVRQNILYRIAKEIHGYTGPNTMQNLIAYFGQPDKEKKLGIYYGSNGIEGTGWYVNVNWGFDKKINLDDLANPSLSTDDIMKKLLGDSTFDIIMKLPIPGNLAVAGIRWLKDKYVVDRGLDTDTETPDKQMNAMFWAKIRAIIDEERKMRFDPTVQKKVENDIITYCKTHATNGYVTLPLELQYKARQCGRGDWRQCFFRYDVNTQKLLVCTGPHVTISFPPFVATKETIQYAWTWDTLSEEDRKKFEAIIKPADDAINKLSALMQKRGGRDGKDDALDIPVDIERLFVEKITSRQTYKRKLQTYHPSVAYEECKQEASRVQERATTVYQKMLRGVWKNYTSNNINTIEQLAPMLGDTVSPMIQVTENDGIVLVLDDIPVTKDTFQSLKGDKKDLATIFFTLITNPNNTFQINNEQKTLQEIAKTDPLRAAYYAKQLLTYVLESIVLVKNQDEIVKVSSPTGVASTIPKAALNVAGIGLLINTINTGFAIFEKKSKKQAIMERSKAYEEFLKKPRSEIIKNITEPPSVIDTVTTFNNNPIEAIQNYPRETKMLDTTKTIKAIEGTKSKFVWGASRKGLFIEQKEKNQAGSSISYKREAESYGQKTEYTGVYDTNTKKLTVKFGDVVFGPFDPDAQNAESLIQEIQKTANFVNYCCYHFAGKGQEDAPFNLSARGSLEFNHKERFITDTEILDASDFRKLYPTLFAQRNQFVSFLNQRKIRKG